MLVRNTPGKRVNIFDDLPDRSMYQTGKFKMVTGGDIIYAEQKFKGHFPFTNYAKLIYSVNKITKDDFYSEFVKYCKDNKFPVKPKNVVGREMQVHVPGIRTEKLKIQGQRLHVWRGIKVSTLTNVQDVQDVQDISLFKYINSNSNIKLIEKNLDIPDLKTINTPKNGLFILDILDTKLSQKLNNKGVRKEKDNEIGKWMIQHFKAHRGISRDFFVNDVLQNFSHSVDPERIRPFYDMLRQQDKEEVL